MPFRSQGKQNFSFIAASEIPLYLEDFRGQNLTLLNNYLGEPHQGVTSACFSNKWLENHLEKFPASFMDQASRLLMFEVAWERSN